MDKVERNMIKDNSDFLKPKVPWRKKINAVARQLRQQQTESERILWGILRDRRIFGKKFLRQHPIIYDVYLRPYYFIADFYCAETGLVIELDGSIHDYQVDYDESRTMVLKQKGLKVLRIKNEELDDINKVIEKIHSHLT